jgi:anaerobic selenocysteine-containing dehydrogenase
VAPVFSGLTVDKLASRAGRDGVVVMLPTRRSDGNGATDDGAEAATDDATVDGSDADATAETDTGDGDAEAAADAGEAATPAEPDLLPPTSGVSLPVWTIIDPPSVDAYSLRLVVTRKLYDRGTLVRTSPSLADLAEPATLHLHPHDFDRLGVAAGDDVRITSTKGNVTVPIEPDLGVPRSVAHLHANRAGGRANILIDGNSPVTDVRVERP